MRQREKLLTLEKQLKSVQISFLQKYHQRYLTAIAKLDALSPLKVLTRGYAMVQTQQGVVRSVRQVSSGEHLNIRLNDGQIVTQVLEVEEDAL